MTGLIQTSLNDADERFHTTHWSVIIAARAGNEHQRRAIISDIATRYWRPVYCYLRRKGYREAKAKDLTQGFFCEIILGRELIQHADQAKGRFRTLLLTALERYLVSIRRKEGRKKRQPRAGIRLLEIDELSKLTATQAEMEPDEAFYHTWAADLLDLVLAELKDEYCSTAKTGHWKVFWAKVVVPIIDNVEAPSYTDICSTCGIEDESKAANMVITVKRRFRAILKRHLRNLVQSDSEVENELREVFAILSRSNAG
jgi:DNA-directed RNA polymerase specialized sigma24 family protein